MLNLWKDEYARRRRLGVKQELPNVFGSGEEESRGRIPHDQLGKEKVRNMVLRNLRTYVKEQKGYERYQVDKPEGNPLDMQGLDFAEYDERYGNLYWRNLMKMREIWAEGRKQGEKEGDGKEQGFEDFVDTLDIIPSMKLQFKQMYKKKSKKLSKMEMEAMDNTRITQYYDNSKSQKASKVKPPKEQIKEETKENLDSNDDMSVQDYEEDRSEFNTGLSKQNKFKTPLTESQKPSPSQYKKLENLKYKLRSPSSSEVASLLRRLPTHKEDSQKLSGIFFSNEKDLVLHYANRRMYDPKTTQVKKVNTNLKFSYINQI